MAEPKYKIMGNMIWFMESAEPPRQVTAIERELLSELACVRGLLQGLVGIAAKVARREYLPSLEQCRTIRHAHHEIERYDSLHAELAQQLAAIALPSGAESADIGKLDNADKSGGTDASSR